MDKFIVIDIESPNKWFNSISAIAIIIVENNKIIDKIYTLINPEDDFEEDIIDLTGITPEMVEDKPKFNEFWPKIEKLLVTNVIVGHNIEYDLTVISNSLNNYNLNVPNFNYICTLQLSRQLLDMDSYSLTNIMNKLNVSYDAHNALADAEVTLYLFNYLNEIKPVTPINYKLYNNNKSNGIIDEDLIPSINELYGSILEFRNKDNLTDNQIKIFQEWIDNNLEYSSYNIINNIILKLNVIFSKESLNKEDIIKISTLVTNITRSNKYSKEELDCQVLDGILKMLECDETVSNKEIDFLNKWLTYYNLEDKVDMDRFKQ